MVKSGNMTLQMGQGSGLRSFSRGVRLNAKAVSTKNISLSVAEIYGPNQKKINYLNGR